MQPIRLLREATHFKRVRGPDGGELGPRHGRDEGWARLALLCSRGRRGQARVPLGSCSGREGACDCAACGAGCPAFAAAVPELAAEGSCGLAPPRCALNVTAVPRRVLELTALSPPVRRRGVGAVQPGRPRRAGALAELLCRERPGRQGPAAAHHHARLREGVVARAADSGQERPGGV
jgi:hypothetical protein